MALTLPNDYFLKKQNQEFYVVEKAHEDLFFTRMFQTVDNDTGTFMSLESQASALKDIQNKIMSDVIDISEGVEFTDINFSEDTPIAGHLRGKGFGFSYSDLWESNGTLTANLSIKLSKATSAMCFYIDSLIGSSIGDAGAVTAPTFSDWSDDTAIDAKNDNISINENFSNDGFRYKPSDVLLNATRFFQLWRYLSSFDGNAGAVLNGDSIVYGGKTWWNLYDSIDVDKWIALSNTVPAALIEKRVNPKYSFIKQAEMASLKTGNELKDVPASLINYQNYKPEGQPDMNRVLMWCNVGLNVREPHAIMQGTFES